MSIFPGKLFDNIDSRGIDYLSILKYEERGRIFFKIIKISLKYF